MKNECLAYLFKSDDESIRGIKPIYMTKHAAAADCAIPNDVVILAHETVAIPLYIGFEIPKGYCIKMYPRSSTLICKGLLSMVSIIDEDYSGQKVHVIVNNITNNNVELKKGERICQVMLEKVNKISDCETLNVDRNGGLGSTL